MPQQTITYDDFEKSLEKEGIEIIIPEVEEQTKEGTGAGAFTPRKTAPSYTNPYYLKKGYGGYNRCILIQGNSCLANCVGYAFGRCLESGGKTANAQLPTCNAEDWYATAKANGMKVGSKAKVGAIPVWKSGNFWTGADGCGHVGFVEDKYPDGSILVSQSNYGGTRFFMTVIKPPYSIFGQTFVGFIYNPYLVGTDEWRKDGTGWWYEHADGSYTVNGWEKINGKWYHFDEKGYMQANTWIKDDGNWYWLQDDGAMLASSWLKYKENWYFLGKNGAMFIGKHTVPVFFNSDGEFIGNWQ